MTSFPANTVVNGMVRATTEAMLKFMIVDTSKTTQLTQGIPQRSHLIGNGKTISFSYTPTTLSPFLVAVTPFTSGDPNLYVSSATRDWNSTNVGADYVSILPVLSEINSNFIIKITSKNASVFTVLVTESSEVSPTILLGGFAQEDYVGYHEERYYKLYVPPGHEEVVISVESLTGNADLYVNAPPKGFYHFTDVANAADWQSIRASGQDSVSILSFNRRYISNGGVYYITVYGSIASKFLIRGFLASTVITLTEEHSLVDRVSRGYYHYYRVFDANPTQDIMFDVKPMSGDVDLLISCIIRSTGDDSGIPSRLEGHYNYSAQHLGEDALVVRFNDPKSCNKGGIFYLATYGYSDAQYVVTVKHHGGTVVLKNGQPYQDMLFKSVSTWYRYEIGLQPVEVKIVMSPAYGDVDMFVKLNAIASLASADYSSWSFGAATERITIPETATCSNCWVSILVYAFQTSQYTITVSTNEATIALTDSLPLQEMSAANRIQYYSYTPASNGSMITVLTLFSGKPTVYVSTVVSSPNIMTPNTTINNDALNDNLPIVTYPVLKNVPVYIGVGGTSNSTFTIRTHLAYGQTPLFRLLNGIPQSDYISKFPQGWKYYIIRLQAGHESFDIRITKVVGDTDLFVSTCPYLSFECVGGGGKPSYLPNATYNVAHSISRPIAATDDYYFFGTDDYSSENSFKPEEVLQVTRSDKTPKTYIIGTRSGSFYAQYQISYTLKNTQLALSPGVSVMDHVEKDEVDYFTFYKDSTDNVLRVVLTPLSGDPDLYISTTVKYPNRNNNTWKSEDYGPDSITIDVYSDDEACTSCTYYIAVVGVIPSTYTITASLSTTTNHLVDGRPVSDRVNLWYWNFYVFHCMFHGQRDLKITMTIQKGDADLYVTVDNIQPNWLYYDYYSGSYLGGREEVNILRTDAKFAQYCAKKSCNIRIGVYGFLTSQYTLTVTSSKTATILQTGVINSFRVIGDTFEYYKVLVSSSAYVLRLHLSQLSGHADMYITCGRKQNQFPDAKSAQWHLNGDVGSTLEIPSAVAESKGCYNASSYAISVFGRTTATYTLLATLSEDSIPSLLSGQTVSGRVSFKQFDYYYFTFPSTFIDIRIKSTSLTGSVVLYVSTSWEGRPVYSESSHSVTTFAFTSQGVDNDLVVISKHALVSQCSSADNCYLVIGAFGAYSGQSNYQLVATLRDTVTTLHSGVPFRSTVDRGSYEYYRYSRTIPGSDFTVTVTPFFGDPDLYVTMSTDVKPSKLNFTWASVAYGADTLTVQSRLIDPLCNRSSPTYMSPGCDFYIGVYGGENCSYTIVAFMNEGFKSPLRLFEGQPQHGSVERNEFVYYRYVVGSNVSHAGLLPDAIVITLTPLDDGDQVLKLYINL